MDQAAFWKLIHQAREQAPDEDWEMLEILQRVLLQLPADEITSFNTRLHEQLVRSYRNDLWAAAYIINGGCSDDGFVYFRCWLIGQGQTVFENALRDPETLADQLNEQHEFVELEDLLTLPARTYQEKTGQEIPWPDLPPYELTGPDWEEESVDEMFPRLTARVDALLASWGDEDFEEGVELADDFGDYDEGHDFGDDDFTADDWDDD